MILPVASKRVEPFKSSLVRRESEFMSKLIQNFKSGDKSQKELLGGKGANLAEMVQIGLPVPPGFTITTDACRHYLLTGEFPANLVTELFDFLDKLEVETGKKF